MPKMSDEAARAELARIAEDLEIKLNLEETEVVARALRAGRVEWDSAEQAFSVQLQGSLRLDNGSEVTHVILSEPTALQMKKSQMAKDIFEQSLLLIAACTGQPIGYIERLKARDLNLLGALVGFFR